MSKIEVLAVTMNAENFDLVNKMQITSNAIIANQARKNEYAVYSQNKNIKMVTTTTRGVGANRNLYASGDICVLADDDMIFDKNYEQTVYRAFTEIPEADILIFNLDTIGEITRNRRNNTKITKVNRFNVMNYGAARVAFKLNSIRKANLFFSVLFGGGCPYSSGEDTLFLYTALKKGLKIYTYPKRIATVTQTTSSWFEGYTDKYFRDKGALYYALTSNKITYNLLCVQDAIRHQKLYKRKVLDILHLMIEGMNTYKNH